MSLFTRILQMRCRKVPWMMRLASAIRNRSRAETFLELLRWRVKVVNVTYVNSDTPNTDRC